MVAYGRNRNIFRESSLVHQFNKEKSKTMDKDRVEGMVDKAKGKIKEGAGKLTGDRKLEADGKADKAKGEVKNVVGGLKDTLRGE